MANIPISFSISRARVNKDHLRVGSDGKEYLDAALWPNKHGTDKNGNTHYIVQNPPRELRAAGEKGAIIGNAKVPDAGNEPPPRRQAPPRPRPPSDPDLDAGESEIPF